MLRAKLAIAMLFVAPSIAAADDDATELGGWFGPRIFSTDSKLGYIAGAPFHPMLNGSIELGARASHQFIWPWLFPEFELAMSPTSTTPTGTSSISVFWFEPRFQLRFEILPKRRIQPFVVVGGGSPVALSSARMTFNSGITGDGYLGGGVRIDTQKGFTLRFDARMALVPGVKHAVSPEADIGVGLEFVIGGKPAPKVEEPVAATDTPPPDRDGDGIPDSIDKCPDRPEDKDGFEDADGCPDIDNDMDGVLDIADKCPTEPETYNGYMDDDGCPDTVPPEVDALRGTIEGLLYADGETAVRESAMGNIKRIAKVMAAQPSIKIVLIGHTDDREAKAFAPPPQEGQPPPDIASLATDLSRSRAEAVRQALISAGVASGRIVVDGVGAEESVADNNTAKGRLANRRVELKLFVPQERKK